MPSDFLSDEWFDALNQTLTSAGRPSMDEGAATYRVVLEFVDGPSNAPHALTFTVNPEGAFAEAGDHLAADAMIRLSYADAERLTSGSLESAGALREGKLKIRGDLHTLVPLLAWLVSAHPTPAT